MIRLIASARVRAWDWKIPRTAEALDIQRSHLYRKLRALGIPVDRRETDRRER